VRDIEAREKFVHVAAPEPPQRKGNRARKRLVVEEELSPAQEAS
jgi:hypothetical protein